MLLIAAPHSTKNRDRARDPETHQTEKAHQWRFSMDAHIGADADPGISFIDSNQAGCR